MASDPAGIRAVVFDYGNTLIEFTAPHVGRLNEAIAGAMRDRLGEFDEARYRALRNHSYRAPYFHPELRENQLGEVFATLVGELFDRPADAADIDAMLAAHHEAFVDAITAPVYLDALLTRLRSRFALALISNYPCGDSIRASLKRTGIDRHLDAVVVSGDLGHVKPHPLLFRRTLDQLRVEPAQAVYVGDNWLGDIQGAKRIGMHAVHICQFDTLEVFDREPDHVDADGVIHHLTELEAWLNG